MLEVRYNKDTKELTGWWGNRFGNEEVKLKNRPDEVIVEIDSPIPDKPLGAWLYDGESSALQSNPDYEEPVSPRDSLAEIDDLKAELETLKKVKDGT